MGNAAAQGQLTGSEESSSLLAEADGQSAPQAKPATLKPGVVDHAGAQAMLDAAFGSIKTIAAGAIQILDQADFETAYDAIYGTGPYSWAAYVVPTFGNLEGFAHNGTNYINAAMASDDTIPHEMLHVNTAADFPATMGHEFEEGTTEYMTIHAMTLAGKTPTHSYPNQEGIVRALVAVGLPEATLFQAYLTGGTKTAVFDWIDANCKGTAAEFVAAMEAQNWALAKTKIQKK